MSARPFRHLCPEADLRDAMTDAEFWAHVYPDDAHTIGNRYDWDAYMPAAGDESPHATPCPTCGESFACGYDAEGRPMYHPSVEDDR